jgi:hypothetical protein
MMENETNEPEITEPEKVTPKGKKKEPRDLISRILLAEIIAGCSAVIAIASAGVAIWQTNIAQQALNDDRIARAPDLNPMDLSLQTMVFEGESLKLLNGLWTNSGGSPTTNLSKFSGCGSTPLEAEKAQKEAGATVPIAPGASQVTGGCYLTDELMETMLETQKPHFISANAIYFDRFGTKFKKSICYGVTFNKTPTFTYNSSSQIVMQNFACDTFSCKRGKCELVIGDGIDDTPQIVPF